MKKNFYILLAIFLYLAIWGLIKPVYQGPDERGHENKVLTWSEHPWIYDIETMKVDRCQVNPLQFSKAAFLEKYKQLSTNDILALKNYPAFNPSDCRATEFKHPAAKYPPVYYALVNLAYRSVSLFIKPSPYQTQQILRLISALLAALVWLRIWQVLKTSNLKNYNILFLILLLNPVSSFISGTVNPDVLVIPLSHLLLLYILQSPKSFFEVFLVSLLIVFVKPSGFLLLGSIFAGSILILLLGDKNNKQIKRHAINSFAVCTFAYLSFYFWSKPFFTRNHIYTPESLLEYLTVSISRLPIFYEEFWTQVGDVNVTSPFNTLLILTTLLLINLFLSLRAIKFKISISNTSYSLFLLSVIFYIILIFLGEYSNLEASGLILQGRYFVPLATLLIFSLKHQYPKVKILLVLSVIILNIQLLIQIPNRYLTNSWHDLILMIF